jgi:hypothetical protein
MPLSRGKVDFAWNAAVGAALQRVTSVRLEGHQLIVDAKSPQWARAVVQSRRLIQSRLDALLGEGVVTDFIVRS